MIDFDFSTIHKCSVIDTCAILNLLSSSRFYTATINETFFWCYTSFVEYEVFYKPVKKETPIHYCPVKAGKSVFEIVET